MEQEQDYTTAPPRQEAVETRSEAEKLAAGHDADQEGRELDADRVAEIRQRIAAADGSAEQKFGEDVRSTPEGRKAQQQMNSVTARERAREQRYGQAQPEKPAADGSISRDEARRRSAEAVTELRDRGKARIAAQEKAQQQGQGRREQVASM